MTKTHILHRQQDLPLTPSEAWNFFSNPGNLNLITPPSMGFIILSPPQKDIINGQIIEYRVRPFLGFPLRWTSEISGIIPQKQFVDTQLQGPYSLWRHLHVFKPNAQGVSVEDYVEYALPDGLFYSLAHKYIIRKKLENIFDYRQKKLNQLFQKKEEVSIRGTSNYIPLHSSSY